MISGVRHQVLTLACLRHGVPEATAAVADSLVRSLDAAELRRAFVVVTDALVAEIERADADLAS